MAPKSLLDLPDELLLQLPVYMHNFEDFKNASSTCRHLHNVFADTLPKTILRLASGSAPTFFSPHPYFLVLAVARQIATWAVANDAEREFRVERLVEAFRGGIKGLLSLALQDNVEGVGLAMEDVRKMYEARFSIINPLNTTMDAMIGDEWYRQPDFWSGGAEDAFTLYADVSSATFQFLTYGELFGSTMASYLQPGDKRKPGLGIETRIEYIKYCIPDWACGPNSSRHDGFEVLPVGPYAEGAKDDPNAEKVDGNQTALVHLVGGAMFEGTLWKRAWRRVLIAAGAEENEDGKWPKTWIERIQRTEFRKQRTTVARKVTNVADGDDEAGDDATDWRFSLFWNALTQVGGLQTMGMVAQFKGREGNRDAAMKPEWKAHILRLRDQVLALKDEDEPGFKNFGKRRKLKVSEAPNLGAELYWCCAGMWMGF
ncbi:hypothetical protein PMIN01_05244 [Paraphaeosphaeria minitans]|uniref:F-box domain-containing protein n=1 Tax=Paraphaeosphaeria minitans TaxID=565426 RepID=A0A9P6GN67_9PLEO|nr:hypothetical protein PMIN01_05244 [Paraphaeosphaeria minitans]